jgi:hypothetical protein
VTSVKDNLIAARALIDTPEKWGKGEYEPRPGCYCMAGAIFAAKGFNPWQEMGSPEAKAIEAALDEVSDGLSPWRSYVDYNDNFETTHADIMALFDRAIEAQP